MNKVIFIGRSGCGKTSLTQALMNENIHYHKTQYVSRQNFTIDTPGEYIESRNFGGALAVYSYESDIVCLLLSATEPYSLYPPCITNLANRPVIGVVTHIDKKNATPERAENWLKLAGCKKIFFTSAITGEGIKELKTFLSEFDTKKYYRDGKF